MSGLGKGIGRTYFSENSDDDSEIFSCIEVSSEGLRVSIPVQDDLQIMARDYGYGVLDDSVQTNLTALSLNDIHALQGSRGFTGEDCGQNFQFSTDNPLQEPHFWPSVPDTDAVTRDGTEPDLVLPIYPFAAESMESDMPFEGGGRPVVPGIIMIELEEAEPHATIPQSPYQQTGTGPFYCTPCNIVIQRKSDYNRHFKTTVKHGGKRYVCRNCRRPYTRQTTLRDHKCRERPSKRS